MENTTLLKELLKIRLVDYNGNFSGVNAAGFENLLNKVQILTAADENKNITSKARINFINKAFNKNKDLDKKPILKCYSEQLEGYKTFTTSFSLYCLKDADFKPLENIINKADESKYPDIKSIVKNDFKDYCYKLELKVNDLLTMIKVKGVSSYQSFSNWKNDTTIIFDFVNVYNEQDRVGVAASELLLFINVMNYNKDDIITFYFCNKLKPLFAENKNNSIGLILPVRVLD